MLINMLDLIEAVDDQMAVLLDQVEEKTISVNDYLRVSRVMTGLMRDLSTKAKQAAGPDEVRI